jgi:hypothetical protein
MKPLSSMRREVEQDWPDHEISYFDGDDGASEEPEV